VNAKILIVDDEKHVLDSLRRGLARRYDVTAAEGAEEGLAALHSLGPFAVVISDLAMPGMDGVKFLAKVKDISPMSVRMMLTGHGDYESSVAAVNEGHIFRFLTKPCPIEAIIRAIDAGIEQYRLVMSEKELLRGTLRGCIKVLIDILNLVSPEAFSRGERIKRLMMQILKRVGMGSILKYELAGMLSQIGMVAVPQDIVFKRFRGMDLSPEEAQIYRMHATVASTLLSQIPRMNEVVEIVSHQVDCMSAGNENELPESARLLNLCLQYDDLDQLGIDKEAAVDTLRPRWAGQAPELFKAFEETVFSDDGYVPRLLPFKDILPGMVLRQDIFDEGNTLIMAKGQEITEIARLRLSKLRESYRLPEAINVLVPLRSE
jgi:FixJ family two-component response regulator